MDVPLVMQLLNIPNDSLHVFGSFFAHSVNPKHKGMTLDLLRQVPREMTDPLMIVRGNKPDSYVFVVDLKDTNGATVVVSVEINKRDNSSKAIANVIDTAFGKTVSETDDRPSLRWFRQRANRGDVLYINKKKSIAWLRANGNSSPAESANSNALSKFIVSGVGQNVKTEVDLEAAKKENPGFYQSAIDAPSEQKESVRKQYEGTARWMKAPNGEPTNLTEDQWIAVRTPAFKAWFGDWEAEAEKQKYLNTAPINVTDKKITKSRGITARDAAMAWADVHLPVQVSTRFGVVEINRTSVKDSLGHGFSQKKLDAITSLPEGMKVAAFIGETKDFNGADIDNGYFCYPIMYQGEKQVVFCRARRDVNSNKIYVHEVWTEDEIRGIPLQTAAKFSNSKPHGGNTLYKSILADFLNKGNDCSKIVGENGEPLVVYHGSDADFDVFDKTKGRANMDIQGMFFSPWELDSKGYGGNVRAFFLNIRKPATDGKVYEVFSRYEGQNYAGIKAREDLENNGYDGAINGDMEDEDLEFVAFEPNQIKSVDNNGAFSADDDNIFHQETQRVVYGELSKEGGKKIITLFEGANESTFLHEMGHMFLMDLDELAKMDEASAKELETVNA